MRFRTMIAIMLTCAASGFAQEHMADTLRNGILEEDSKQNPRAAIQQYQAVMTQFAGARQTAATALFRMAECYRKQGNRPQAIAAYQRLLKDFADQSRLAAQSRNLLATIYSVPPGGSPGILHQDDRAKSERLSVQMQAEDKKEKARGRYREAIEREMALVQSQISEQNPNSDAGKQIIEALQLKIIHLQRDLAAFDAGMTPPAQ